MKKILSTIAVVFVASALTGLAQDATPAPNPPQQERHWKEGGRPGGPGGALLESLTPAERQQFLDARKKAEADPAVTAAKATAEAELKEAREAHKAAMLKADPTIGPILEKIEAAMKAHAPRHGEPGKNAPQE